MRKMISSLALGLLMVTGVNAQEKGDYGWLQRAAREQAERNKNKKVLETALQMTTTSR